MEEDYEVSMDEVFATYEGLLDSLDDEADVRVVLGACLMLIAKCNMVLGIMPTEIEGFEKMVRPLVLEYRKLFRKKDYKAMKLKK